MFVDCIDDFYLLIFIFMNLVLVFVFKEIIYYIRLVKYLESKVYINSLFFDYVFVDLQMRNFCTE